MPVVRHEQDRALGTIRRAQQCFERKDGDLAVVDGDLEAALELLVDGVHDHRDDALVARHGLLHLVDELVARVNITPEEHLERLLADQLSDVRVRGPARVVLVSALVAEARIGHAREESGAAHLGQRRHRRQHRRDREVPVPARRAPRDGAPPSLLAQALKDLHRRRVAHAVHQDEEQAPMLAALEELRDHALGHVLDGEHFVRGLPGLDPRHVCLGEALVVRTGHGVDGAVEPADGSHQGVARATHPAQALAGPVEEAALFGIAARELDRRLPRRAMLGERWAHPTRKQPGREARRHLSSLDVFRAANGAIEMVRAQVVERSEHALQRLGAGRVNELGQRSSDSSLARSVAGGQPVARRGEGRSPTAHRVLLGSIEESPVGFVFHRQYPFEQGLRASSCVRPSHFVGEPGRDARDLAVHEATQVRVLALLH